MYFSNNNLPATTNGNSSAWINLIQNFPYIDNQTRALVANNPSLFRQVFPTAKQRMISEIKDQANLDALRALFQFQDLALKEELNDRLMRGAASIRAETIKEAQNKLVEVSEDLSQKQQRLITAFQKDLDFCNSIKSPLLREKYQNALVKLIEEAFDTFEKLSRHFTQFLDTRIGTPVPSSF